MIIEEVTLESFKDAFRRYDRSDNFSSQALEAIFNYLQEGDEDITLDVIEICCEFTEYPNFGELQDYYGSDQFKTVEDFERKTLVQALPGGGYVIRDF